MKKEEKIINEFINIMSSLIVIMPIVLVSLNLIENGNVKEMMEVIRNFNKLPLEQKLTILSVYYILADMADHTQENLDKIKKEEKLNKINNNNIYQKQSEKNIKSDYIAALKNIKNLILNKNIDKDEPKINIKK